MQLNSNIGLRCSICGAPISTIYNFAMPKNGANTFDSAVCGECNLKYILTGIAPVAKHDSSHQIEAVHL